MNYQNAIGDRRDIKLVSTEQLKKDAIDLIDHWIKNDLLIYDKAIFAIEELTRRGINYMAVYYGRDWATQWYANTEVISNADET